MASEQPCTIHDDGKFYNLNPLKSKADYELKSLGGHDFVLNVCQRVSRRLWNIDVPDPENVGAFIRQDHGDFSVGSVNTTLAIRDTSPLLLLESGSICPTDDEMMASTTIHFICDTSVVGVGKPAVIAQSPTEDENACSFVLDWRTPVACPTSEPNGLYGYFSFFLASLVVLLMIYLICGAVYNRFVLKLSGFDQVPRFSMISLKYHVNASLENLRDILEGFCHSSRGMGQRIAGWRAGVNRNRDLNPLSHQWMHDRSANRSPNVDDSSPTPGRRRFGVGQGVAGTREEREPIMQPDAGDGMGIEAREGDEDSVATPTVASVRKGMDSEVVIHL